MKVDSLSLQLHSRERPHLHYMANRKINS